MLSHSAIQTNIYLPLCVGVSGARTLYGPLVASLILMSFVRDAHCLFLKKIFYSRTFLPWCGFIICCFLTKTPNVYVPFTPEQITTGDRYCWNARVVLMDKKKQQFFKSAFNASLITCHLLLWVVCVRLRNPSAPVWHRHFECWWGCSRLRERMGWGYSEGTRKRRNEERVKKEMLKWPK